MYEVYALMMDRMLREDLQRRYPRGAGRPVPARRARRRRAPRDVT